MNAINLFDQACALIRENDSLCNSKEAWNIVRALKILIEANKLEEDATPLKIKIIMAMASCNYQIDNLDLAYNCAMIAKEKINEHINLGNSHFDELSARRLLREEDCDEIIEAVKNIGKGKVRLIDDYVLSTLCTINLRKSFPPKDECSFTRNELYNLIKSIESAKNAIASQAYSHGDNSLAKQVESIFNAYKYPLYYIWQKYGFGRDEEVWEEGESMMPYHIFESNIKMYIDELMLMLNSANPFAPLRNSDEITQLLHNVLSDLCNRLQECRI